MFQKWDMGFEKYLSFLQCYERIRGRFQQLFYRLKWYSIFSKCDSLFRFDFVWFYWIIYLLTWIMKVDFLQITRLSPTSFNISLPRKTQITPRYAKPQKKKNIKTKCLHSNIKLNIHFWLNRCNGTVFIYLHSTYYNSSPKAIVI